MSGNGSMSSVYDTLMRSHLLGQCAAMVRRCELAVRGFTSSDDVSMEMYITHLSTREYELLPLDTSSNATDS